MLAVRPEGAAAQTGSLEADRWDDLPDATFFARWLAASMPR